MPYNKYFWTNWNIFSFPLFFLSFWKYLLSLYMYSSLYRELGIERGIRCSFYSHTVLIFNAAVTNFYHLITYTIQIYAIFCSSEVWYGSQRAKIKVLTGLHYFLEVSLHFLASKVCLHSLAPSSKPTMADYVLPILPSLWFSEIWNGSPLSKTARIIQDTLL